MSTEEKKQTGFEVPEELKKDVNTWKGKYKKVKYLDLGAETTTEKDENGKDVVKYIPGKVVFFRMPTRQEMAAAENLSIDEAGKTDSYKKAEKIMVDCYLGGQLTLEEIMADIELYMAVAGFCLYDLVNVKNVNWGSI